MKTITATIVFKVTDTFAKETAENDSLDYRDEIEELLDYDCDVSDPIVVEEGDQSIKLSFDVNAYLEILDNDGDVIETEEDVMREIESGISELQSILEDGIEGDVEYIEETHRTSEFKDEYDYKNYVLKDSTLGLLENDLDFEDSFKSMVFDSIDMEFIAAHTADEGLYVQGIYDDGEHFTLAVKYSKEKNEEDFYLLAKHMNEIYPAGNLYFLEIVEKGESDNSWEKITEEDDEYEIYFKAISLKDIDPDSVGFYAADSLLCCLDDDYESQIEDEEYY